MDYTKIRLGIIGSGKWGLNHIRTAHKLIGKGLIKIADINQSAAAKISNISEKIQFSTDINSVIQDKSINSVIISTPAETHYELTKKCIIEGKNVLTEKPITILSSDAYELIKLAKKYRVKLMVGHVLLYHPAILKIKELIKKGKIGKLQYIYSNRLNLGTIRSEENILWSFAPHDVSVIQYLLGRKPLSVCSEGATFLQKGIEDTTFTYINYPGNIHAHIFVSWLHPFKEQRLVIIGDKGMFVFEDSIRDEKLKFYKKGFSIKKGLIEKFESEYVPIPFAEVQPLEEEQKHFFECIINNKNPRTDGKHAKEVLEILEEAQKNLMSSKK